MKNLKIILIFFLLFIIQTTLVNFIALDKLKQIKPDLILIFLVYLSLVHSSTLGTIYGFVTGLVLDFYSSSYFGLNALSKTFVGFIIGRENKYINVNVLIVRLVIIFIATIIHDIIYFCIYLFRDITNLHIILLTITLPVAIYNLVVGLMLSNIFDMLLREKNKR